VERPGTFADARASLDEARFVIVGVPFDRTTSFRPGARFGPDSIRQHSWNFESYDLETGVDLSEVPIHDLGNAGEFGTAT
jgi:agmatinase